MLGILAPEPVADAFRSAGVTIATNTDIRQAAKAIRDAMSGNPNYPVLVINDPQQGYRVADALVQALRGRTSPVLVAGEDFTMPVRMGELAEKLGVSLGGDHDLLLGPSGHVEEKTEDEDDWLDDSLFETSEPEPAVAEKTEAPPEPTASRPATPVGWGDEPPTREPEPPVAQPAPDGWGDEEPIQPPVPSEPTPTPTPPSSWARQEPPAPQQSPRQKQPRMPAEHAPQHPSQGHRPPGDDNRSWALSQQEGIDDPGLNDILQRRGDSSQRAYEAPPMGVVLFMWAGGGGVGKSTYSRLLAQLGAEAGMRSLLLDGNRGQADQAQYVLRNTRVEFPTINAFARTDDIDAAIMTSEQINTVRGGSVARIGFDTVFSPTPETHDLRVHTPQLYRDAVDVLTRRYDLIVVDTQTLDKDLSDLWVEFILPMMREGAWAVGTSDMNPPKMKNLISFTRQFSESLGVNPARSLSFVSLPDPRPEDGDTLARSLTPASTFVGVVAHDEDFQTDMSSGSRIPTDNEAVAPVAREIMKKITGLSAFSPPAEEPKQSGLRALFSRKKKGKG